MDDHVAREVEALRALAKSSPQQTRSRTLKLLDNPNLTEDERDRLWQQYGRETVEGYDPADYNWLHEAPDGICRECYQWRRYPEGQEHFGWAGWRVCRSSGFGWNGERPCDHAHHQTEVWMANIND